MDLVLRLLGIHRSRPVEMIEAERVQSKVDSIVREHRDKVAEEFRRTEDAMRRRPRVP
jgi:hypothetical protein